MSLQHSSGPIGEPLRRMRVGLHGLEPMQWLGRGPHTVELAADWVPGTSAEEWVDVVVIDANLDRSARTSVESIIGKARSNGIKTILFSTKAVRADVADSVDLVIGPADLELGGTALSLPPVVDLDTMSPVGALPESPESIAAMRTTSRRKARKTLHRFGRILQPATVDTQGSTWLMRLGELNDLAALPSMIPDLRTTFGVIDHGDLHDASRNRARYLASLAVAGIPYVLLDEPPRDLVALLGADLLELVHTDVTVLTDPIRREELSIEIRREGLKRFTPWNRWRDIADRIGVALPPPPTVSIVLATNRPRQISHALDQVARQLYHPVELIVVMHGSGFGDAERDEVMTRFPTSQIVEVSADTPFGEALNHGVEVATGEYVTKMDDDDWYGPEHLHDLTHAIEYSGADLVGKAAEWVYLEELDITVRRFADNGETYTTTLAGGTLMMRRVDLVRVGGFRRAHRHIDLGLITDVQAADGSVYRMHGYGYLLNRRSQGHTWDVESDYFLDQSSIQIPGLSMAAAMADSKGTSS